MKYYLFLDECGDHNLSNYNPTFPIFTLSGIIMSESDYALINDKMNKLKEQFWGDKTIIFHSRDIRKLQNGFEILFDLEKKKIFYEILNSIMQTSNYTIISCSILKQAYIKKFGRLEDDVYGLSLSFIMERTVLLLDNLSKKDDPIELEVFVEKRGKKEDTNLLKYYNEVLDRGTYYINPKRMKNYFKACHFEWKKANINGLQLSDLVAYPISRYVLDPKSVNFPYDIIEPKFYRKNNKSYGMKVFP